MLQLKTYQQQALDVLEQFLLASREQPLPVAFRASLNAQQRDEIDYQPLFGATPCVCLRIPTGGGKTLLAAHLIALASAARSDNPAPVALWLTPSDTIRRQTLEALSDVRHPYRQALAQHFGAELRICDLDELATINTHDVGKSAIIIVATIQAFNITDTKQRNVYAFDENLAAHFAQLPSHGATALECVTAADLTAQPFLTANDIGRIKYSIANWLHLQQPLIIVDEAHNNRTARFFNSLQRLNPSAVIELTATPVAGNNVLYSVSAQELKAEQMIKLPIVLLEHPDGWQACLSDAVLNRNQLELTAQKETAHIRPILLVQAAPKGGEATVDVVREYLIEHEQIPEQHIAIATGTQKELDGINLFERSCQIRVVITIEALKEGWDCSFAYVLASLQNIKSAKDIEQLLGRVLRMPYAKMREQAALNCAYAHVIAESFASAAATLTDRLVQNMGFERLELAAVLIPQTVLPLTGGANNAVTIPAYSIEVPQLPDTRHWPASIKAAVDIRPTTQGATLLISSALDAGTLAQVESLISAAQPAKARAAIQEQFAAHRALQQALRAPAHLGIQFAPVPHLCLRLDDHLEVVEPETLAAVGQWNLLDHPVQLAGFAPTESVNTFEIDLNEQQVNYRYLDGLALQLNEAPSQVTEDGLLRELDRHLRRPSLSQLHLQRYLIKLIAHLIHDRGFTLTALVRWRVQLVRAINKEIERLQHLAMQKGFQQHLPKMVPPSFQELAQYSFQFDPGKYPARNCYQGRYQFSKHFYPTIHDLRETTASGLISEEFRCAQMIDMQAKVKHWVRNIERQAQCSFWLPTASDRFYPDFVAELNDGRVFTVEYKGEFYKSNDDSREKKQVGQQWETSSNGRCLFLFAVSEDEAGRSIGQQIKEKLV